MKGFKKFLAGLYFFITGLFFLAAAFAGVAQVYGFITIPRAESLDYYFTLPSLMIAGGVLVVFGLYGLLMIGALKNKRGVPVVKKNTPDGDINISVNTIKTIAEVAIKEFDMIELDQTGVMIKDNTVDIFIKVFVTESNHVTDMVMDMQTRVKDAIEQNIGIVVNSVRILINDVKGDEDHPLFLDKSNEKVEEAPIEEEITPESEELEPEHAQEEEY